MPKYFGESTLARIQVYESINDDNIKIGEETVLENRLVVTREIAMDLNISYGSTRQVLVIGLVVKRVNCKLLQKEDLDLLCKVYRSQKRSLTR